MMRWRTNRDILNGITEILKRICNLEKMMSSEATGISQLQQAEQDEAAAVAANTVAIQALVKAFTDGQATIADLTAKLSTLNSEDPAVAALAAEFETAVTAQNANTAAINAVLTPAAPPAPAPAQPAPDPTPAPAANAIKPGEIHSF